MLISEPLALCSLILSELNGLFDELGIASDLDAQKAVHRILYMLGEGLDHDKLNDMLRNGTIALKLQANFQIFGAPVDLSRWVQVGSRPDQRPPGGACFAHHPTPKCTDADIGDAPCRGTWCGFYKAEVQTKRHHRPAAPH